MRRTTLLLTSVAVALLVASGVALAVTKHCGKSRCLGTQEDDRLLGNDAPNWMIGRGGDDTLKGFGFGDGLSGGPGRDTLYGCKGRDNLSGDRDNDKLFAGPSDDMLWGGLGRDHLNGSAGSDTYAYSDNTRAGGSGHDPIIEKGAGFDLLYFASASTADLTIDLTSDAKPNLRNTADTGTADWEGDVIGYVQSTEGDDTIVGNDAPNSLWAGGATTTYLAERGATTSWRKKATTLSPAEGATTLLSPEGAPIPSIAGTVMTVSKTFKWGPRPPKTANPSQHSDQAFRSLVCLADQKDRSTKALALLLAPIHQST